MSGDARIGLEVHVPLATRAKLYCRCPADPGPEPNTHLCPTCTGQPGARPQGVNRHAIEQALVVARLLDCRVQGDAVIQRKHYVYPDLPNNYQRTSTPVAREGRFWDVEIEELHVEEDPGAYDPDTGHVDLDRSGTPLVEIVTRPDLSTPDEVVEWLGVLQLSLDRAGVTRPDAELKADVNVSTAGGDRVEVKNVVGGRNAARAAAFEIDRQRDLRSKGKAVPRATRHFEEDKGLTRASRHKETVGDYRYMPDPDLNPIDLAHLADDAPPPEDVPARLNELVDEHALQLGEAMALMRDAALEALFDALSREIRQNRAIEIALMRLRSELDYRDAKLADLGVSTDVIVDLSRAWDEDEITKNVFTRLLREHLDGGDVRQALEQEVGADVDLEGAVDAVVQAHPEAVEDYKAGKDGALNFLVGQVMAATQGRAEPRKARAALARRLDG